MMIDIDVTQADLDAAEAHFDIWYPDTAWGFDALAETLAHHRQYGYDQGYYDGCTRAALEARGLEIREKASDD